MTHFLIETTTSASSADAAYVSARIYDTQGFLHSYIVATIVGTAFGRSHLEADCQFCGACVDVCPTGSLADKRGKWEGVPTSVDPERLPVLFSRLRR
jgi:ferredoxin